MPHYAGWRSPVRLPARVTKLEADSREQQVIVLWRHYTETDEQAKARWRTEHPGQDLESAGLSVTIIGWAAPEPDMGMPR